MNEDHFSALTVSFFSSIFYLFSRLSLYTLIKEANRGIKKFNSKSTAWNACCIYRDIFKPRPLFKQTPKVIMMCINNFLFVFISFIFCLSISIVRWFVCSQMIKIPFDYGIFSSISSVCMTCVHSHFIEWTYYFFFLHQRWNISIHLLVDKKKERYCCEIGCFEYTQLII